MFYERPVINPLHTLITEPIELDNLILPSSNKIEVQCARLDKIHPTLSGNKIYKLLPFIEQAEKKGKQMLLSFGGMHSNHLHALAFAGKALGMPTIGIVRAYENQPESKTLIDIRAMGMHIENWPPKRYQLKSSSDINQSLQGLFPRALIIPEGGADPKAIQGFSWLLQQIHLKLKGRIDYFISSAGTGTTLAGCMRASAAYPSLFNETEFIGIAAVKDKNTIENRCNAWVSMDQAKRLTIIDDYTFGGFAKVKPELARFMLEFEQQNALLLDPIYTAKMLYAINDLADKGFFREGSRLLCLHTGGLQGRSGLIHKIQRLAKN